MKRVAIVGAGFSSAILYDELKKFGCEVKIFEKSRGVGGRCSTKYIDNYLIDHGTSRIEPISSELREFLNINSTIFGFNKRDNIFIPTAGINSICKELIDSKDLIVNSKINSVDNLNSNWILKSEGSKYYDGFDLLIFTIPATQALEFNNILDYDTLNILKSVNYDSIASLIIYSKKSRVLEYNMNKHSKYFQKIENNSSKYGYSDFSSYVIHLNRELSKNLNSKDEVNSLVVKVWYDLYGVDLRDEFEHIIPHLWKYAFVKEPILKMSSIYNSSNGLGFVGDYFLSNNLDGAFLSVKDILKKMKRDIIV